MLLTSPPTPHDQSKRTLVGVLTVDDQAIFRSVARDVIEATPEFELLGEAASGTEAVALAAELDPDLVLLDVRMPAMDGLEAAERIRSAAPSTTIVLLSTEEYEGARSVRSCGASAFLRKQAFGPVALRALWADHGRRPA
jgi:two-component system, NarL family, invasion response regulator UvrY